MLTQSDLKGLPDRIAVLLSQFDLTRAKRRRRGWVVPHPGREDKHPSVWITVTHDRVLLCDRSGGATDAILRKIGCTWRDLFPHNKKEKEEFARLAEELDGGGSSQTTSVKEVVDNLELRHAVYTDLLSSLSLTDEHATYLKKRGIDRDNAARLGYASLPFQGRKGIVDALFAKYGNQLSLVPGFPNAGGNYRLSKGVGLAIPVRTQEGLICAVKVRQTSDLPRFLYLSGSVTVSNRPHFPLGFPATFDRVTVTEGEVKADSVSVNLKEPCIAVPGMGQWQTVIPYVEHARTVVIAFDQEADPQKQATLRAHIDAFAEELISREVKVEVYEWGAEKGSTTC